MFTVIRQIACIWVALVAALSTAPARSQTLTYKSDIDIYTSQQTAVDPPNVLFVLDNSANWSSRMTNGQTKYSAVVSALSDTVQKLNLGSTGIRAGLMMFTENGAGNSNTSGGYVRASIRDFSRKAADGTTSYQSLLASLVAKLDETGDKGAGSYFGSAMAEAYRYFSLTEPIAGNNKNKTDWGTASSYNQYTSNNANYLASETASNLIYKFPDSGASMHALDRRDASKYQSFGTVGCGGNYIVIISNGPADSGEDTAARNALQTAQGTTPTQITGLSPSNAQSNWTDEWARFMRNSPQQITTFTVDVAPDTTNSEASWSALLRSAAVQSKGEYFKIASGASAGDQLRSAFQAIFNQIMAYDSAFASASLPVSANAQGVYLNQVFIGMFRPDANASPRWRGNLKQYQFLFTPDLNGGGTLQLADASSPPKSAIGLEGFLNTEAVSFWTEPSTFWVNQPTGKSSPTSDSPDGESVEKGGVAQRLRTRYLTSQADRKVYTCLSCSSSGAAILSNANSFSSANTALTASLLGVSATDRTDLINWVRGANNKDEIGTGPSGSTVRPSIHGDVLHSRPTAVNYGGSTGVIVFYGANDGTLRAINGAQAMPGGGEELWAFIAPEHFLQFSRLREGQPEVRMSTTNVGTTESALTPKPRDYFMDGPIGVYQQLDAGGNTERVIIYPTMRRGGRVIYAIDVTDPTNPKFLWKRAAESTDSTVKLAKLGQTWSEPRIVRLKSYTSGGVASPVLIMGAGYDAAAEDLDTPGATTMGNAVLVLDALTGAEVNPGNPLGTDSSVPSDVTLIDSDADGYVDRAYAVDTGGNVYRLDFESSAGNTPDKWTIYKFASLSADGPQTASGRPRKFFYPPDVVLAPGYAIVQVGSGDREKPLDTKTNDAFFTLFDPNPGKGKPASPVTLTIAGSNLQNVLSGIVGTPPAITGCYIPMAGADGEKIVNAPTTVAGVTYFSTNTPATNVRNSGNICAADRLGRARVYSVPLACKAPTSKVLDGGGLPPSIVSGLVLVTYKDSSGKDVQRTVPFIIGAPDEASKQSAIEGSRVKVPVPPIRKRKYWYRENAR